MRNYANSREEQQEKNKLVYTMNIIMDLPGDLKFAREHGTKA